MSNPMNTMNQKGNIYLDLINGLYLLCAGGAAFGVGYVGWHFIMKYW